MEENDTPFQIPEIPKSINEGNTSTSDPLSASPASENAETDFSESVEILEQVEVKPVEVPPTEVNLELPEPAITKRKPQNIILDKQVSALNPDLTNEDAIVVLPSETATRTEEIIANSPNIDFTSDKTGNRWANTVRRGLGMNSWEDMFLPTLENPNATFYQNIKHNGRVFGSSQARFPERQNTIFSGEQGVLRAMSHLGLGTTWNVALANTGIWVTFKPPSEEDLVEHYRQLTSDQIRIGRSSYGLAYANTTSFTIDRMCQFAAQFIYRVNADSTEIGPANILQHLKAQDISSFLWGFACTMYPRGFNYNRACMVNPEKCQHVTNELLNLRKLQLINNDALTEIQKSHLSDHQTSTKLTIKDLKTYEAEMVKAKAHRFVINEGEADEISINLRSPSVAEYIETGHRWINDMVNSVEQVVGSTATVEEKNRQIDLRASATIMRQYSHWVSSIEIETNKIDDRDTIEKTIAQISSSKDIRETFIIEVKKFIENSSVSVIGIPTYDCPACGKANEGPVSYPQRVDMIPIDVVQLFFALLTQNLKDLENR